MEDLRAIIEAMIFSSEAPISVNRMKEALGDVAEKSDILREIEEIKEEHINRAGGFTLEEIAGGYQFRTRADLASWIRKLRGIRPGSLSPAAMETLAVIAYRQPVLKADIDRVRGVDVSGALKGLLEKKLIKMLGRKDVPGRPMMYGTSREFLESFNLKDLSELPTLRELKELQEEMAETGDMFEAAESAEAQDHKSETGASDSIGDETGQGTGDGAADVSDDDEIPEAGESDSGDYGPDFVTGGAQAERETDANPETGDNGTTIQEESAETSETGVIADTADKAGKAEE